MFQSLRVALLFHCIFSEAAVESKSSVPLVSADSADSSSSSESSSESGINEESVLASLGPESIEKPSSAKAKEETFYLHEHLGTLHRPHCEWSTGWGVGELLAKLLGN